MKKYSEKELKAKAEKIEVTTGNDEKGKPVYTSILKENNKVYATEDGQIFDEDGEAAAIGHARGMRCKVFTIDGEKKAGEKEKKQAETRLDGLKQAFKMLTNEDAGNISEEKLAEKLRKLREKIAKGEAVGVSTQASKETETVKNVGTGKDSVMDELRAEYAGLAGQEAPVNIKRSTLKKRIAELKKGK